MSTTRRRPRWKPTVGVLVSSYFDPYQEEILAGCRRAVEEVRARLVSFAGAPLEAPTAELAAHARIFELVRPGTVDVLLVLSGCVGERIGARKIGDYVRAIGIPAVSIGLQIDTMASVIVDNRGGMGRVVEHLVEVHGRRHLAFVRGPRTNDEAEARFRAYLDALTRNGLAHDDDLIVDGSWDDESGHLAVQTLVDDRGAQFDALVCADDNNALHAMEALRARGFRVPGDVAVVGFDDIPDSHYSTPPLTTVRQPLHRLGLTATRKALKLVYGEPIEAITSIATNVILRESCGCSIEHIFQGVVDDSPTGVSDGAGVSDGDSRPSILPLDRLSLPPGSMPPVSVLPLPTAEEDGALAPALERSLAERHSLDAFDDEQRAMLRDFLRAIDEALATRRHRAALAVIDRVVDDATETGSSVSLWIEIVTFSIGLAIRSRPGVGETRILETLWRRCLFSIYRSEARNQSYARLVFDKRSHKVQQVGDRLITSLSRQAIGDILRGALPTLGIVNAWVCLLDGSGTLARCILQHGPSTVARKSGATGTALGPPLEDQLTPVGLGSFPPRLLAPFGLTPEPGHWATVQPLVSQGEMFGFCVFEQREVDGRTCALLAGKIASALKGADLVETIQRHNAELEGIVAERTKDLVDLNRQLREQSFRDQLSGLHNRHFLMEIAIPEVSSVVSSSPGRNNRRSTAHRHQWSVIVADLDHFKQVNDLHGHDSGDAVLRQLSRLLETSLRTTDHLIRTGGEEFLFLLRDADPDQLPRKLQELLSTVARQLFELPAGGTLRRTCSMGALSLPFELADGRVTDVLKAVSLADKALYAAKHGGRNRAVIVHPGEGLKDIEAAIERFDDVVDDGRLTREVVVGPSLPGRD